MTAATRAYLQSLPRKTVSAAALIRDTAGAVLLVKPTYKPRWEIPGGIVEADESPADACHRELREELGLAIRPGRLLAVAHRPGSPDQSDCMAFLFHGGTLDPAGARRIALPRDELSAFRFVPPDEVAAHLAPFGAARIAAGLSTWNGEATQYFDHGA